MSGRTGCELAGGQPLTLLVVFIAGAAMAAAVGGPAWLTAGYAGLGVFAACMAGSDRRRPKHRRGRDQLSGAAASEHRARRADAGSLWAATNQPRRTAHLRELSAAHELRLGDVACDVAEAPAAQRRRPGLIWVLGRLAAGEAHGLPIERRDAICEGRRRCAVTSVDPRSWALASVRAQAWRSYAIRRCAYADSGVESGFERTGIIPFLPDFRDSTVS